MQCLIRLKFSDWSDLNAGLIRFSAVIVSAFTVVRFLSIHGLLPSRRMVTHSHQSLLSIWTHRKCRIHLGNLSSYSWVTRLWSSKSSLRICCHWAIYRRQKTTITVRSTASHCFNNANKLFYYHICKRILEVEHFLIVIFLFAETVIESVFCYFWGKTLDNCRVILDTRNLHFNL